jgi:hypothetical protein
MKYITLFLLLLFLFSCKNKNFDMQVFTFTPGPDKIWKFNFRDAGCANFEVEILYNSLNDTAMLGIASIPPNKTGRLFITHCHENTKYLNVPVRNYKATTGKVIMRFREYSGFFNFKPNQ